MRREFYFSDTVIRISKFGLGILAAFILAFSALNEIAMGGLGMCIMVAGQCGGTHNEVAAVSCEPACGAPCEGGRVVIDDGCFY